MNVSVRPADLEIDRELIIDTLFRYLTPCSDDFRFDWLYMNNPHGQARAWLAIDTTNHTVVGMAAAFPRRIYCYGHKKIGWVLGDFCIHDQYRSLGPALQLQRACLAEVDSGSVAFCYDFPSTSMLAIYKRLRISPSQYMIRLAKPLRVERTIEAMIKTPMFVRGLSRIGNILLELRDLRASNTHALTLSLHDGDCGEEFSILACQTSRQYKVCAQRSAAHLNWRYLSHPHRRYELMTVRRGGDLLAYAVFTQSDLDATLVDLFGVEEQAVINCLVRQVVAVLRNRGVAVLHAPILKTHPWGNLLKGLGFRERETKPVVIYPQPHSQLEGDEGRDWFFVHGDRDS